MTLSYWQRAARASDVEVDVAVVGGGLVGCAAAYWLRRRAPGLSVAVVERGRLASGASGRNAGFLLQGAASDYLSDRAVHGPDLARRLWHFTRESRDLIFSELRGAAFALQSSGSLTVAASEAEDDRLRSAVAHMRADGAPAAYVPADEANRRLGARGFLGALSVPSGAMLDPVALVRHVAEASGATLLEHHRVLALAPRGGQVLLETPVRRVRAGRVVLALNAYLPQLVPALGRYVRPVRAQMLATVPSPARWLTVPVYSHEGYFYVRQDRTGALLAGGARHLHREAEVGFADETTEALQSDLEDYLHRHFPRTEGLGVAHRWSGVMGFSPDHVPVVGGVPGLEGSIWAAGFSGHGMGYGFRFGRLLAALALGDARPEGLDLFTADRFDEAGPRAAPAEP